MLRRLRCALLGILIPALAISLSGCGEMVLRAIMEELGEAIANGKLLFLHEQRYCILWGEDEEARAIPDGTLADSMPFPTFENWMEMSRPLAELPDELKERCDRPHCFFAILSLQELDEAVIAEVTRTLEQCGHFPAAFTPAVPARWSMNE